MIATPDTPQGRRALELAIINMYFQPNFSAAQIAVAFTTGAKKLHASDVTTIWAKAKEAGDLPKLDRPAKGPRQLRREPVKA